MAPEVLIRWSGLASILGGTLYALFMFFHPANDSTGMRTGAWAPVHLMWHVAVLLALLGLVGLYARQAHRAGRFGLVSFVVAFVGTALSVGETYVEAFVLPALALEAPGLLERLEAGEVPAAIQPLMVSLLAGVALFILGYILFGITILRAGVLPRPAGLLLIIGAPLFTFGTQVHQAIATGGAVLFGAGFIWLGYALWSSATGQTEYRTVVPVVGEAAG